MIRVWRIPFSTNVERVALALGHKGLDVEWIEVDPSTARRCGRSAARTSSRSLEDDGRCCTTRRRSSSTSRRATRTRRSTRATRRAWRRPRS